MSALGLNPALVSRFCVHTVSATTAALLAQRAQLVLDVAEHRDLLVRQHRAAPERRLLDARIVGAPHGQVADGKAAILLCVEAVLEEAVARREHREGDERDGGRQHTHEEERKRRRDRQHVGRHHRAEQVCAGLQQAHHARDLLERARRTQKEPRRHFDAADHVSEVNFSS